MTRNPGRSFGLSLALLLVGLAMVLGGAILPALGVFGRSLGTPLVIFGLGLPFLFGLVGVMANARPAALQRALARGRGLVGEWTITPEEWEEFVRSDFGPAVSPDSRGNALDLNSRPPRSGLKVTVGEQAIRIGSQLFDLRPTKATAVLAVGTPVGRPGVIELKLAYATRPYLPSRGELRFPLGPGQEGVTARLAELYPDRGWTDTPSGGILQRNPAKALRVGLWVVGVSLIAAAVGFFGLLIDSGEGPPILTIVFLVLGVGFMPGAALFVVLAWLAKRRARTSPRPK